MPAGDHPATAFAADPHHTTGGVDQLVFGVAVAGHFLAVSVVHFQCLHAGYPRYWIRLYGGLLVLDCEDWWFGAIIQRLCNLAPPARRSIAQALNMSRQAPGGTDRSLGSPATGHENPTVKLAAPSWWPYVCDTRLDGPVYRGMCLMVTPWWASSYAARGTAGLRHPAASGRSGRSRSARRTLLPGGSAR